MAATTEPRASDFDLTPRTGAPTAAERVGTQVGVTLLLALALAALGLAPLLLAESYDWTLHGVSESAAQGAEGAWLARFGFGFFGAAVLWLTATTGRRWGRLGRLFNGTFGVSMIGVAVFSARSWEQAAPFVESEDRLHSIFATVMGFAFVAGVLAVTITRKLPSTYAAAPDVIAIAISTIIPLLMGSQAWGLLQRIMFLTAALWYGREAWMSVGPVGHETGSR